MTMDQSSLAFRAYGSRKQALIVIAALAPMLTGMGWTLVVNSTYPLGVRLFFASMLVLFALVLVGPVHRLIIRGPSLEVGVDGFRFRGWSAEKIGWDAVDRWKPITYLGIRYVTIWLHEPHQHRATTAARRTQRANGWFGHGDISITGGGLNRSSDEVVRAFKQYAPKAPLGR